MLNVLKDNDLDDNDIVFLEENNCEFIGIVEMNRE